MGIPRIARREKAPTTVTPATEIMAEPVDDWFDADDVGVIVTEAPSAEIMAEPVDETIDVDDDDDYPEPPVSGDAGYTMAPADDDDAPILTAPVRPLPRPPTTYFGPPDPVTRGSPPPVRAPTGAGLMSSNVRAGLPSVRVRR